MPRGSKTLRSQARKMVYDVYCSMEKEAKEGVGNLKQIQKRTAIATNTSVATVKRIIKEANHGDLTPVFRTPGKKRSIAKSKIGLNDFEKGIVRRIIQNFHLTNKEVLTVNKLLTKLRSTINFQGSDRSLRRIIKELDFQWKNTKNNRKILIEKTNIRFKRIEYIENINHYRMEGRPIIYTAEFNWHYLLTYTKPLPNKLIQAPKKQRIIIVFAGSENGFIQNSLLMFKSDAKSPGNQDDISYEDYENWLHIQLIPNLPPNSVVVVSNAAYHNKQLNLIPSSNSKKADMLAWLADKGIPYSTEMLKPQLYDLISMNKEKFKQFHFDKLLEEHNHTVLRLPSSHKDLNLLEMVWAGVKDDASKDLESDPTHIMNRVKEKLENITAQEWSNFCDKTKLIEEQYMESEYVVDEFTEKEVIVQASDSSDSDSSDSVEETEDTHQAIPGIAVGGSILESALTGDLCECV